jgi:hypothetical protein
MRSSSGGCNGGSRGDGYERLRLSARKARPALSCHRPPFCLAGFQFCSFTDMAFREYHRQLVNRQLASHFESVNHRLTDRRLTERRSSRHDAIPSFFPRLGMDTEGEQQRVRSIFSLSEAVRSCRLARRTSPFVRMSAGFGQTCLFCELHQVGIQRI